jgi:hypothetical protein
MFNSIILWSHTHKHIKLRNFINVEHENSQNKYAAINVSDVIFVFDFRLQLISD